MRRSLPLWTAFLLCLTVVLAAMAWVSATALRLDRAEAEARRQTALEEKVRLALWRADSTLAPLVAQESVRPWFAYRSFFPADRAYNRVFNDRTGGERLVPSPLLTADSPNVLVHFQFEPDGKITSPQVPSGSNVALAVPKHRTKEAVQKSAALLEHVKSLVQRPQLLTMLPEHRAEPVEVIVATGPLNQKGAASAPQQPQGQVADLPQQSFNSQTLIPQSPLAQTDQQRAIRQNRRQEIQQRAGQDAVEYDIRNDLLLNSAPAQIVQSQASQLAAGAPLPTTDISGVPMTPLWIGSDLLLARRVAVAGQEYIQGCLLDWPAMKKVLCETIADLLPEADFEPVLTPNAEEGRMLAALPVRLLPGPLTTDGDAGLSPILLSLGVAWACMVLAAGAVAVLLAGVSRLSERRATFVSAVTHELRTPLTTFQMYAEMLAEGMVPEGPQQRQYLNTLRAEAVRLTHLVENVLSYARLERGRTDGRRETLELRRLVDNLRNRLAGRAEQAGMELVVEDAEEAGGSVVCVNVSAVEQILFNLVDNASKYAADAADKRIHLTVRVKEAGVELCIRDHGGGIPAGVRRRLFRPFSKSASEAAHTAPGVGLGLALSRRLARDMGGDLRLEEGDGASFVVVLPRCGD